MHNKVKKCAKIQEYINKSVLKIYMEIFSSKIKSYKNRYLKCAKCFGGTCT